MFQIYYRGTRHVGGDEALPSTKTCETDQARGRKDSTIVLYKLTVKYELINKVSEYT